MKGYLERMISLHIYKAIMPCRVIKTSESSIICCVKVKLKMIQGWWALYSLLKMVILCLIKQHHKLMVVIENLRWRKQVPKLINRKDRLYKTIRGKTLSKDLRQSVTWVVVALDLWEKILIIQATQHLINRNISNLNKTPSISLLKID